MTAMTHRLPKLLLWIGVLLLVAGLQAWGFNRQTVPLIALAADELAALQHEVADNHLMNQSLRSLQSYSRTMEDALSQRQIIELRDYVLDNFGPDPAAAVATFANVVSSFQSRSVADQEALADLKRQVTRLQRMYTDHYASAIDAVSSPAWFLQPTAFFLTDDSKRDHALALNHALYFAHIRDAAAAIGILDALRAESEDDLLIARTLFLQARLQFDAYRAEKDPAYFRESLQYAQRSVMSDADHDLAKMFLDYLVSLDRQAIEVDVSPLEGEGSGEGEGERGAIATEPEEF